MIVTAIALVGWLLCSSKYPGRPPLVGSTQRPWAADDATHEDLTGTTTPCARLCVLRPPDDDHPQCLAMAQNLSDTLALPLYTLDELQDRHGSSPSLTSSPMVVVPPPYALVVEPWADNDYAIGLQALQVRGKRRHDTLQLVGPPWKVDFGPTTTTRRRRRQRGGDDLLVQAVRPTGRLVDLTAGWGRDGWLLAQARGVSHVTLVERHAVVATLLQDGVRRAAAAGASSATVDVRLGDGTDVARRLRLAQQEPVEIVYLDPMFPARQKSALVKKDMQILHTLLDSQDVAHEDQRLAQENLLLQEALALATRRVVVKRPIHAPCVGDGTVSTPSYDVRGSTNRWDVYLV